MDWESGDWGGAVPPVGVRCEAMNLAELNVPVECIIIDHTTVAYKSGFEWAITCILHGTKFRKLRTERERTVEAAVKVISADNLPAFAHLLNTPKDAAEKLYDAGMLRLPVQE